MPAWDGAETADITYKDTTGTLTTFLIDKGYLLSHVWENARPMYYLEVKTTTQDCDSRFFMSKSQYKRVSLLNLNYIFNICLLNTKVLY
jgi:hypothetical protein